MKSKRWKRRNRHTRPEWVKGYRFLELEDWWFPMGLYLTLCEGRFYVSDNMGNRWTTLFPTNTFNPQHLQGRGGRWMPF